MSNNKDLPPCCFTSIFIGSQGSGKTYSAVKLLKKYEKYPIFDSDGNKLTMRVIEFCPTIHSTANPIYESLKYLNEDDIILDCSDDKLLDKLHEIKEEKRFLEEYNQYED
jgi:adenylate kinase family enzyme